MKVMVPVKRVVDPNAEVRVTADGSGVDLANLKMSISPFDEIGVEEAVRLKEPGGCPSRVRSRLHEPSPHQRKPQRDPSGIAAADEIAAAHAAGREHGELI
jgi:hypothetical protein